MPQITIGPSAEAGVHIGTLKSVGEPYEKTWPDGKVDDQIDWEWALPNGEVVRDSTSTATGPKSRLFQRLVAHNNGKGPQVGQSIELNDFVGRRAILTIEIKENGWPKITNVGPLPLDLQQRDFAAATGAPVREPVAAAAPQDDLDF